MKCPQPSPVHLPLEFGSETGCCGVRIGAGCYGVRHGVGESMGLRAVGLGTGVALVGPPGILGGGRFG